MNVHHTKVKHAMAMGCHLSAVENRYRIFWPQRSVELFELTVDDALDEMKAVQNILHHNPNYKVVTNHVNSMVVLLNQTSGNTMVGSPDYPTALWAIIEAAEDEWVHPLDGPPEDTVDMGDRINGVPRNGTVAFKEGVPAADCPYPEESDDFSRWNNEWDEAADEEAARESTKAAPVKGSVVTNRYRATYSEYGHPTHCGDELAILINNICLNKAGINLQLFEEICRVNGINLGKYSRITKGWQGRLRMTGRNLLAKRVRENGGKLMMPVGMGVEFYQLSQSWLVEAEKKYKPKPAE